MNPIHSAAPPIAPNPSVKFLLHEKINFINHITESSKVEKEITYYTRSFYADTDLSFCNIKYYIPFCGSGSAGCRFRVVMYLDDEPIAYDLFYGNSNWDIRPINFDVSFPGLRTGEHKICLKVCCEGGTFYMPYYGGTKMESKTQPLLFATVTAYGII